MRWQEPPPTQESSESSEWWSAPPPVRFPASCPRLNCVLPKYSPSVGPGALLVGVESSCSCVPHPLRVVTCRVWFELTKKLLFSTHEPPLTARFLRWWFGGMGLVGPIKGQTASSVPTRQTSGFMRKFSDASHGMRCYLTT